MGTTSEAEIESAPEYAQNPAISLANKKRKTPQPKNRETPTVMARRHRNQGAEDPTDMARRHLQPKSVL
ncbi:hypothetical protein INT44_008030 [Umbelopsis vinacea]|uniref:Uncharacterized protein n=1 Tax=Umbelopsis vinacea TaxID=44442 RepID=A0A8H7UFL2_9FUNG|nr:hypothetical protein INT44_008030 [Umbelopsis vinacea]